MQITKNDNAANSVILDNAAKCSAPRNKKAEAHMRFSQNYRSKRLVIGPVSGAYTRTRPVSAWMSFNAATSTSISPHVL
jgi:hypothetical protein